MPPGHPLAGRFLNIPNDIGNAQAGEVVDAEMGFGKDALERHALAPIAFIDASRSLGVHVDDLRMRRIDDVPALGLCPLGPGHILETRQRLIVSVLLP